MKAFRRCPGLPSSDKSTSLGELFSDAVCGLISLSRSALNIKQCVYASHFLHSSITVSLHVVSSVTLGALCCR